MREFVSRLGTLMHVFLAVGICISISPPPLLSFSSSHPLKRGNIRVPALVSFLAGEKNTKSEKHEHIYWGLGCSKQRDSVIQPEHRHIL